MRPVQLHQLPSLARAEPGGLGDQQPVDVRGPVDELRVQRPRGDAVHPLQVPPRPAG